MPLFSKFNEQNKLRIPLSAYAAQIIEDDCFNFNCKKTTLINSIILNFYEEADCTISLRLNDYKKELEKYLGNALSKKNEPIINKIIEEKAKDLAAKNTKRRPADVNWQIKLNKKVSEYLTKNLLIREDLYYGDKPGHYVRALLEEYAELPYHLRERIRFKQFIDCINTCIKEQRILNLTNIKETNISLKPFRIEKDPLSMYHYLIGYNVTPAITQNESEKAIYYPQVMSIRISRLKSVDMQYTQSGALSPREKNQILDELEKKKVQFVSGESSIIKVRLSDTGIKKYESQIHLRPIVLEKDPSDYHIYTFECTEAQILYYFFSFGKDAKILYPESLASEFRQNYDDALRNYIT